jgi:hypothetical protein
MPWSIVLLAALCVLAVVVVGILAFGWIEGRMNPTVSEPLKAAGWTLVAWIGLTIGNCAWESFKTDPDWLEIVDRTYFHTFAMAVMFVGVVLPLAWRHGKTMAELNKLVRLVNQPTSA